MTAVDIESAYDELVSSIERESRRLKQALAEQQMKDEGERLKKIQVSEGEIGVIYFKRAFRMNLNMKKRRNPMRINKSNKKKKNFDSRSSIWNVQIDIIEFRRSALAQRQREEDQLKGKLTAEEAKRQVQISTNTNMKIILHIERTTSSRCCRRSSSS